MCYFQIFKDGVKTPLNHKSYAFRLKGEQINIKTTILKYLFNIDSHTS